MSKRQSSLTSVSSTSSSSLIRKKLECKHDSIIFKEELQESLSSFFDIQSISILLAYSDIISKVIEFDDIEAKILAINLFTLILEAVFKSNTDFLSLNVAANVSVS